MLNCAPPASAAPAPDAPTAAARPVAVDRMGASPPVCAPAASPCPHLLVAEHDPALRAMLCDYMDKRGWFVSGVGSAEELLDCVARVRPDVVIVGTGLPRMGAMDACRRLRAQDARLPLIVLADGGDARACIEGLQCGADECLAKPVPVRVLATRARALLGRTDPASAIDGAPADAVGCRIGAYTFVPQTRSLHGDGRVRALNDVEFGVMLGLVRHPGQPVARERLLQDSGLCPSDLRLRSIDTAVMRLRRLLEPDPAEPRYLQTVRGRGYMFVPPMPRA